MKNLDVMIRPFDAASDTTKLSRIWLDASLDAHSFIGKRRLLEQRRLIEEQYLPNSETWVAVRLGEPVGFISLLESFIGGIFVAPGQQGQGIGRKLIAHALERKGKLSLEVYLQNRRAVRFYEGLGFVEVSRRANDDEGLPLENAHLQLAR
ncbi:GNAT family N-acetyltransferase [Aquicoccus porphyridii]|uniref:GNAT family N-acetyltransferase n=1 Tax=Aquicoccus porphyridii TaxID=1852029 RepID=A0A5A9ZGE8_9RHOB|nr:GNAT family N-acetyltransferase [Aquicoccus porphyridii]KAA0916220.1 GNAT family N-acetyltransferase [Aquicoccus porphyridii]RAI53649.1 GNAT family N-acetyltransferase [Rhodobacteraceae bacterium AsT-22]